MDHDNTLYLEKSTNWVMDLTPAEIEKKEIKDGQIVTIYYFDVRRREGAPIVTNYPEYGTKLLRVHHKFTCVCNKV